MLSSQSHTFGPVVAHLEPEERARERAPVLRPAQRCTAPRTCAWVSGVTDFPPVAAHPLTSAPVGAPISVAQMRLLPSPFVAMT